MAERWFELRYGTETSGFSDYDEDDPAVTENVWYHPTESLGLRRVLRQLRPSGSDTFATWAREGVVRCWSRPPCLSDG